MFGEERHASLGELVTKEETLRRGGGDASDGRAPVLSHPGRRRFHRDPQSSLNPGLVMFIAVVY